MWKRLKIYQWIIMANFAFNLVFYTLNEDFLNYIVPKDIAGYLFWLSLGLYLGFIICKNEIKRVYKKQNGVPFDARLN